MIDSLLVMVRCLQVAAQPMCALLLVFQPVCDPRLLACVCLRSFLQLLRLLWTFVPKLTVLGAMCFECLVTGMLLPTSAWWGSYMLDSKVQHTHTQTHALAVGHKLLQMRMNHQWMACRWLVMINPMMTMDDT